MRSLFRLFKLQTLYDTVKWIGFLLYNKIITWCGERKWTQTKYFFLVGGNYIENHVKIRVVAVLHTWAKQALPTSLSCLQTLLPNLFHVFRCQTRNPLVLITSPSHALSRRMQSISSDGDFFPYFWTPPFLPVTILVPLPADISALSFHCK